MDYQENINNFKQNLSICNMFASQMYHEISNNKILKDIGCSMQSFNSDSFCFRINIPQNSFNVGAISCSIPIDANLGIGLKTDVTYETAIVNTSGDLIYIRNLGYDDVCRFSSIIEVIDEIQRVVKKTHLM